MLVFKFAKLDATTFGKYLRVQTVVVVPFADSCHYRTSNVEMEGQRKKRADFLT